MVGAKPGNLEHLTLLNCRKWPFHSLNSTPATLVQVYEWKKVSYSYITFINGKKWENYIILYLSSMPKTEGTSSPHPQHWRPRSLESGTHEPGKRISPPQDWIEQYPVRQRLPYWLRGGTSNLVLTSWSMLGGGNEIKMKYLYLMRKKNNGRRNFQWKWHG
jgi:hypothetical protein